MAIVVRSGAQRRVERRCEDYNYILNFGTDAAVGIKDPLPDDLRDELRAVCRSSQDEDGTHWHLPADTVEAANAILDTAWSRDATRWPQRLDRFLKGLRPDGSLAFRALVDAGCQPDCLAWLFREAAEADIRAATQQPTASKQLRQLESDVAEAQAGIASLRRFVNNYRTLERLAWNRPEPTDEDRCVCDNDIASLAAMCDEAEPLLEEKASRISQMRRLADGRQKYFVRHPLRRLVVRVHQSTMAWNDSQVSRVLDDLREARGLALYAPDTLKRLRARWRASKRRAQS